MKIQTIEKLFFKYLLEYSYVFLLLTYVLSKSKRSAIFISIGIYGIIFYLLLHYYYSLVPKNLQREYQVVYTFLEYSFFAFLIYKFVINNKIRKFIIVASLIFYFFQVAQYLIATKTQKLDSVPIAVETIFIFIFIFLYLRQFFKENVTNNIYDFPSFYLVVGMLVYLGFGFFFNILVNYIPEDQYEGYWHFTYIPEIIKNLLFGMVVLGYPSSSIENKKNKNTKDIPNLDLI